MTNPAAPLSTQLFDEILATVETIGVDKTIKILKEAKLNSVILNDTNIEFIIKIASEMTGVPVQRILHGSDRTDERKIAIALCVYFIKEEFRYSFPEMKHIFNKHVSALSRYHSLIKGMPKTNPKTSFDKALLDYYKQLTIVIHKQKNQ